MITAFMVFKRNALDGECGLYYTTTTRNVSEEEIRNDALRYGHKVIKVVVSEDEHQGLAVTGFETL